MRLGIYTPYLLGDSLQIALRLADWAKQVGHEVSLYSRTRPLRSIVPGWDQHVRATNRLQFATWSKSQDVILWTCRPEMSELDWCGRRKIPRLGFLLWHELQLGDKAICSQLDKCLAPSYAAAEAISTVWDLPVNAVPWDVGVPLTIKPADYVPQGKLLLPLLDDAPYHTEATVLPMLDRVLLETNATLTVAYNSSSITSFAVRQLDKWFKQLPGRIFVRRGVPLAMRPVLFAEHDLTVWPTHYESLGAVGLLSISMGAPVAAFAIKPITEFMTSLNGLLVRCEQERGALKAPRAVPEYTNMADTLVQLLGAPDELVRLQRHVLHGLHERSVLFSKSLQSVFAAYT